MEIRVDIILAIFSDNLLRILRKFNWPSFYIVTLPVQPEVLIWQSSWAVQPRTSSRGWIRWIRQCMAPNPSSKILFLRQKKTKIFLLTKNLKFKLSHLLFVPFQTLFFCFLSRCCHLKLLFLETFGCKPTNL